MNYYLPYQKPRFEKLFHSFNLYLYLCKKQISSVNDGHVKIPTTVFALP